MRVRIDESRQDHATSRIDDFRAIRQLLFDFVARTDCDDHAVAHQHAAVTDDRQLR